jgi:thiol-disulfide isomerase/thioredoxin
MPKRTAGKSVLLFLTVVLAMTGCEQYAASRLKIGAPAPALRTKTLADVGGDFSRITTYRYPDERMYQYSLDAALRTGKPIVLEFATPGHCTVCDGQLQMLKALMERYGSKVIFLHMDQYENPGAFVAYGVKGDPWTFVIDKKGIVRYKQPGRMLYGEMEKAVSLVVDNGVG